MRSRMAACVAACAAVMCSPASANIIQATFTGTIICCQLGYFNGQSTPESSLEGDAVTTTYTVDTSKATITHPTPETSQAAIFNMAITVENLGTFAPPGDAIGAFTWTNDFSWAQANGSFLAMFIITSNYGLSAFAPGANGQFQLGTCPGLPCGLLHLDTVSVSDPAAPVPGPLAGSGIPWLLILLGLVRRVKMRQIR